MPEGQVTLVIAWVTWVTLTDEGQQGPQGGEKDGKHPGMHAC